MSMSTIFFPSSTMLAGNQFIQFKDLSCICELLILRSFQRSIILGVIDLHVYWKICFLYIGIRATLECLTSSYS